MIGQKFVYRFVTFPEGCTPDTLQCAVARDVDGISTDCNPNGLIFLIAYSRNDGLFEIFLKLHETMNFAFDFRRLS